MVQSSLSGPAISGFQVVSFSSIVTRCCLSFRHLVFAQKHPRLNGRCRQKREPFSHECFIWKKIFPKSPGQWAGLGPSPGVQHIYFLLNLQEWNFQTAQTNPELSETEVLASTHHFGFLLHFTLIDTVILILNLAMILAVSFYISSVITICSDWRKERGFQILYL